VFVTAGIDERGICVCYWAGGSERFAGSRSVLIDFEHARLSPTLFGAVAARLVALATASLRGGAVPLGVIVPAILAPHAEAAGLPLMELGDRMLADRPALILAAATEIAIGQVRITTQAEASSMSLPLPIGELQANAPRSASADAALLGIGATLPLEMHPAARAP
jgi:hypothetical protein